MIVEMRETGNFIILFLQGRVSSDHQDELQKIVESIESQNDKSGIILNLSKVEYVSSCGLRMFVEIMRKLEQQKREFKLCCLSSDVMKIFELVELHNFFSILKTEKELNDFIRMN